MFAQKYTLGWLEGGKRLRSREVIAMPRFVQAGNSSTLFRAANEGCPELSLEALKSLCEQSPWLLWSETPDNASANKRKLWATHTRLPRNALFIPGGGVACMDVIGELWLRLRRRGGQKQPPDPLKVAVPNASRTTTGRLCRSILEVTLEATL